MPSELLRAISVLAIIVTALSFSTQTCSALQYQGVLDHIVARRDELSKHPFFAFLGDESIAPERRMQFAPYWTFFAVGIPDVLDQWTWYQNPRNELEERVNKFIREDDFHYNFFLHDVEKVLGYTIDRYGSYEAVVRHLWSHETRVFRQLVYYWAAVTVLYREDPMAILTTFEAVEAGLTDIFGIAYKSIYGNGGLTELKYFGKTHVELEMNHNVTFWFAEDQSERSEDSLAVFEITDEEMARYVKIADDMFDRFTSMYDSLYDIEVAEDSIYPQKFEVKGYPPLRDFSARSGQTEATPSKDEL